MLAENAQTWDTSDKVENPKTTSTRGGIYLLKEDQDVNAKIANLTRKVEAMELSQSKVGRVHAINESICEICESNTHPTKECPTIPAFKEVLHEQANVANNYKRPFSDTYNPSWQSHPNFSWKHGSTANESQGTPIPNTYEPPRRSLEDTLQAFMQG